MAAYTLKYLWRAVLDDGSVMTQPMHNRSRRFPEITLIDPNSGNVVHKLMPEEALDVVAQLDRQPSPDAVQYKGKSYHWRTFSALKDLEDYDDQGRIVEIHYIWSNYYEAGHGEDEAAMAASLRLLPSDRGDFQPGDIVILNGKGQPVFVPFSLPEYLWPRNLYVSVDAKGDPVRVRPQLNVVCERDAYWHGELGNMALKRVDYVLGWKTVLGGHEYRGVIKLL